MTKRFEGGDHLSWNSDAGHVNGTTQDAYEER
jgi:hypothetical protein